MWHGIYICENCSGVFQAAVALSVETDVNILSLEPLSQIEVSVHNKKIDVGYEL